MHRELIAILRRYEMAVLHAAEHPPFLYERTNAMSESWDAQKRYIDSAASCEAYKVGAIVVALMAGVSIVYAGIVTNTASEISSLQKRATAAEAKVSVCEKAIESLERQAMHDSSVLSSLRRRVEMPKFSAHCDVCGQCRGDEKSEEGGPSPVCEEGFRLLQEDMAK
jgi:hypothetical protein